MIASPREHRCGWLLAVLAGLLCAGDLRAEWPEYQARYAVYRNGKLTGKAEFRVERRGERWTVTSEGNGTHGLARILRARDTETAEGSFVDGRFRPDRFMHHARVAGIDDRWQAVFDWEADTVTVTKDRDTIQLDLGGRALDGLSLKMEIQRQLRAGQAELGFLLVDEDEIKEQNFRILDPEYLETSLGCLETIPVERIRINSTRYTRSWHAPGLDYITVRLEHGKTGGDHMEVRISSLLLQGHEASAGAGCASRQSGG